MDNFVEAEAVAKIWGISQRQVQALCKQGRIEGAVKFGNTWAIPKDAKKPSRKYELKPGLKPKTNEGEHHG